MELRTKEDDQRSHRLIVAQQLISLRVAQHFCFSVLRTKYARLASRHEYSVHCTYVVCRGGDKSYSSFRSMSDWYAFSGHAVWAVLLLLLLFFLCARGINNLFVLRAHAVGLLTTQNLSFVPLPLSGQHKTYPQKNSNSIHKRNISAILRLSISRVERQTARLLRCAEGETKTWAEKKKKKTRTIPDVELP